jgi:hypothetical protein
VSDELDLTDLVKALNEQSDFDRFPPRLRPGGSYSVGVDQTFGAFGGCWCGDRYGHDWPGKEDGEPHPDTPHTLIQELVRRQ